MKRHFFSLSPCCFVACTAPMTRDHPCSLLPSPIWERGKPPSIIVSPGNCCLGWALFEKRTITFALLGSAMHNRVCIAVSNCNPTPSVPSTCSTASLQGVCSSAAIQRVPGCAVPQYPQQPAKGKNAPPICIIASLKLEMAAQWNCMRCKTGKGCWFAFILLFLKQIQNIQQQIYLNPLQPPHGKELKEQRQASTELCTAVATCKSVWRSYFNNSLNHQLAFPEHSRIGGQRSNATKGQDNRPGDISLLC